jgi:aryl-alcohol dehydrogenase-like predicted oxidoreductase/spore coat polysaccharide biosynthesis protein SpsF (cytidylyltransferase family)
MSAMPGTSGTPGFAMKTLVIMQARTTSTRLPGKALLPVAGYPSAVLAALRAGNRGAEILLATSGDRSDDVLAEVFRSHGFRVFRGALHDVLGRYYSATEDLPEDCIVIRLTGDNVVPDGQFIRELVSAFEGSRLEFLATNRSRLPYGVGAEAFTVAALRKAHAAATSSYDREHVGPWMGRNYKSGTFIPRMPGTTDYSHLRCTLDDDEDYQRILRLFHDVEDPVHIGWYELTQKLGSLPREPSFRVPFKIFSGRVHSEFTLGTAQLGMDYGIVNRSGKPSEPLAIAMLRRAIAHGVTTLDTARAYGEAELILGRALSGAWRSRVEVVTKLDPLSSLSPDANAKLVCAAVDESVRRSCEALGTNQLDTLLLHRWAHRRLWGGVAWQRLQKLQQEGKVAVLGASVYEPWEALEALQDPAIQHLQLPMNILDRRWKAAGLDRAIAERPDVVVHARSAFLQGILTHGADCWPHPNGYDAALCVQRLRALTRQFDRVSVADLCLAYVRSQAWITSVVVGCETMLQLEENLELFRLPKLTLAQCEELESALPAAPDALLNPSMWNLTHEPAACQ